MANYFEVSNSELIVSANNGGHGIFLIDDEAEALTRYASTFEVSGDADLQAFVGQLFMNGADAVYVGTLTHLKNEGYILGNAIRFIILYNPDSDGTTPKMVLEQMVEDERDGICRYFFLSDTTSLTATRVLHLIHT